MHMHGASHIWVVWCTYFYLQLGIVIFTQAKDGSLFQVRVIKPPNSWTSNKMWWTCWIIIHQLLWLLQTNFVPLWVLLLRRICLEHDSITMHKELISYLLKLEPATFHMREKLISVTGPQSACLVIF